MDPFRKEEIARMRKMPPTERMQAVVAIVDAGVRIRMATLRAKHPGATDQEIDAALREWLKDERTEP